MYIHIKDETCRLSLKSILDNFICLFVLLDVLTDSYRQKIVILFVGEHDKRFKTFTKNIQQLLLLCRP